MKTEILKELERAGGGDSSIKISIELIESILDRFGLYAIELIGKDEPTTEKNLFGDRTIVPERCYRNELRQELRAKLRKELFK